MAVKRRITVAGYNQNWSGAKTKMEKHKGVARAMKKFPGQYPTLIETIIGVLVLSLFLRSAQLFAAPTTPILEVNMPTFVDGTIFTPALHFFDLFLY